MGNLKGTRIFQNTEENGGAEVLLYTWSGNITVSKMSIFIRSCTYIRLPVTLDAISGQGSVRLEEDGVPHAGVVHRAAFQTHLVGDGSRGHLWVWGGSGQIREK